MGSAFLIVLATAGWIAYFIERDAVAFHKKMSDFWHEEATRMTDRWLERMEQDAAVARTGKDAGT